MSLLGNSSIINSPYAFHKLFYNCNNIVNAKHLLLASPSLTPYCYSNMFQNCAKLTTPPLLLPAERLANYCYQAMFLNCSNLTDSPYLPAISLIFGCYQSMFQGCSKLSSINVNFRMWDEVDNSSTNKTYSWVKGVNGRSDSKFIKH